MECPICIEVLADPMSLPCMHTVCSACAAKLSRTLMGYPLKRIVCPICRKATKHGFTPNYALRDALEMMANVEAKPSTSRWRCVCKIKQ